MKISIQDYRRDIPSHTEVVMVKDYLVMIIMMIECFANAPFVGSLLFDM